ncbi:imelysin family protein [Duncaniella sp.]|uniref:imelysin family protein n=1 Tax=Duncaniella sp. TaxID=2518496 RepID=UPI0023D51975|nr:imelysin family protein [Duncaniella sp.]MDE5905143.1 peptidase M75 [Duncaniella sp.]
MKSKHLLAILGLSCAASLAFSACSDNDDPKADNDDSANIDYTEKNAASWGNYMVQVASLLRSDANSLYDAWTVSYEGGRDFATSFKAHNGGDYSSALSCIEQIIEGCADIANEVGTAKIGDPYQLYISGNTKSALYGVESWYSWHSREDYSNNILSVRNSYYGSLDGSVSPNSLSALIASVKPALDTQVKEAIAGAYDAILAIPQPFRNHINSSETRVAMTACADLEEILSQDLKSAVNSLANDSRLQAIVDNYVDVVVVPTYASLKDKNALLYQAVVNFKNNPSDANFASACNAWLTAREPWEKSEAFLFGPVDALGLDPNMDSWPLDQDNIVQILNSGNYDNLNWSDGEDDDAIEAVQSVRGFHTLEFLLFKDGQPRKVKN